MEITEKRRRYELYIFGQRDVNTYNERVFIAHLNRGLRNYNVLTVEYEQLEEEIINIYRLQ